MNAIRIIAVVISAATFPLPSIPSDGVIEINQACAVNIGCLSGDAPGFPVSLQRGSYRLTSELRTPDANTNAIEILQTHTSLDLNGFALWGFSLGGGTGSGVVGGGPASFARIFNGTIRGFRNRGIALDQAEGVHVERVTVSFNSQGGVDVGSQGLVRDNVVEGNGQFGIAVRDQTLIRDNVITNSFNGPDALFLQGSDDPGGNLCEDESCRLRQRPLLRKFYLTLAEVAGGQATTACEDGFHMASRWELWNVTSLEYDQTRGFNNADSGMGPPTTEAGWAHTGSIAISIPTPNCNVWTSSSSGESGIRTGLDFKYNPFDGLERPEAKPADPWYGTITPCSVPQRVWCIED